MMLTVLASKPGCPHFHTALGQEPLLKWMSLHEESLSFSLSLPVALYWKAY